MSDTARQYRWKKYPDEKPKKAAYWTGLVGAIVTFVLEALRMSREIWKRYLKP